MASDNYSSNPTSIEQCLEGETPAASVDNGAVGSTPEAGANDLGANNPIPGADGALPVSSDADGE